MKFIFTLRILILINFLITGVGYTQNYLRHKVSSGESTLLILKKYHLNQDCDLDKFLEINDISDKGKIISGKTYKLPIIRYGYNGKSIRSTINNYDLEKAKRIQSYNEKLVEDGIKKEHYTKDKDLWVAHHFFACDEESDIGRTTTRSFKIFGDKYKDVTIIDHKLKGCVYYLVSGHGGPDPGAIGKNGEHKLCEDEYAYDITLRLARYLISHDALVYIITRDNNDGIRDGKFLKCDTDERCWENQKIPINQKKRLQQRATSVNTLYKENLQKGYKYQRMIVIHVDSRQVKKRMDMFFYYYKGSKNGRLLAQCLQKKIKQKYNQFQQGRGYTGTVRARDLFMLRETKPTSTYIELGNIQNQDDQKRFILESNREAVAKWLSEGLLEKK